MKLLFIGDVVGEQGRSVLARHLSQIVARHGVDCVVVNGENAAGGFGITPKIAEAFFELGVHAITTGNHVWDKKEILDYIVGQPRLLRPANYPAAAPGAGSVLVEANGHQVGVIQVMGRVFMPMTDCPFQAVRREVEYLRSETKIIFVDIHAETTSEKRAMGWYLDGEVSAVMGSHTHVQTADEEILPKGTGYLTDAGMTGPYHSVIGIQREASLQRFLTGMPARFEVAGGPCMINGAVVEIDAETGRATAVERVLVKEAE